MKFNWPSRLGLICIAIPFAAMSYLIISNHLKLGSYQEYRVEITGYDPVNILTGHYLTFRYKWPETTEDNCTQNDECFACFKDANITLVETKNIENCEAALLLENRQPSAHLTKYSISETEAPILDEMLRQDQAKFSVGLVVFPDHTGQIRNLYINDEPLSKFLK